MSALIQSTPITARTAPVAARKSHSQKTLVSKSVASKTIRLSSFEGFSKAAAPVSFSARASTRRQTAASRSTMSVTAGFKVAVLGAAGGIGQPLSMLMKMNPLVSELALYDIANTPGVAADLGHLNTPSKVTGYVGDDELEAALTGCALVIIPAGVPRKPGMTRDDLFAINAGIVKTLCEGVAKYCPDAIVNIISNPVNSTVPIAAEVFKAAGTFDPAKVMGVTTLDVVRSDAFVAELKGLDMKDVDVPVIGGHAGITILPLLSQTTPSVEFSDEEVEALTVRIQNAGTEVVEAKAGAGSATLSMAYAAARMGESCLRGLNGEADIYECSFVASSVTDLPYFSTKCKLGPNGVEEVMGMGEITEYEAGWLEKLKPELTGSIEKGIKFAAGE
ncbi:hypothetical protein CYMTET_54034 [Cymbomonas tetramitiformis]|uniref:Malate dehydrogenase n=1 Tax=Cymbomonas tetramitiformis TaxID=36881 RepID=A0AAE0BGY0_9CHLO|nr:hypothetical protein CYMTET_54034 [Cymbomonas tetramitiformis]